MNHIKSMYTIILLILCFQSSAKEINELRLVLQAKDEVYVFTVENWSSISISDKFNLCLNEPNGIELGRFVEGRFVLMDVISQYSSSCILEDPISLKKYSTMGVIYSQVILYEIFDFTLEPDSPVAFRICVNEKCHYSNMIIP